MKPPHDSAFVSGCLGEALLREQRAVADQDRGVTHWNLCERGHSLRSCPRFVFFPLTDVVGSRSWVFEDTVICRAPTLRKNFSIFDKALRITLQRKGCIIIININSNKSLLKAIKMKGDGYRSHHSELTPSSCVN